MPMSQEEREREQQSNADKQKAHDEWAAQTNELGHPPLDDNGDPIPDPLEQ
jgi:hypothetical protein